MKKKINKKCLVLAVAMMFCVPPAFAGGSGSTVSVDNQVTTTQGQQMIDDSNHQQSQSFTYAPVDNSKDTVIGSWVHPSAAYGGLPDIPMEYRLAIEQWSEASAKEIFQSLPAAITREMVETYKEVSKEELGDWDYRGMMKDIVRRSIIIRRAPSTNQIKPFPILPLRSIAVEGRDYEIIGRLVFRTKEEADAMREDLGLLICEAGMNRGATHLVPTGEGARRLFDTKQGGLSILSAFAQIFTHANPYGLNVSPGANFSSGANQTEVLPYLRVTLIRALNEKAELAMIPPQPVKAVESKVEISRNGQGSDLLNCPNPIPANGMKRLHSANAELETYFSSQDQATRDLALVRARDDLRQAVRDGLKGEELKTAQLGLASVWWEMSKVVSTDKKPYIQKSIDWTKAAGEKEFPELKVYKARLESAIASR